MYFYTDRILIQFLAFSLGPLIGLIITAFLNFWAGIIVGFLGFIIVFLQPYFSDLCLRNTAGGLGLNPIICAEGKVAYLGTNINTLGKLFLTEDSLVFVVNNEIDFSIPITSIVTVEVEKEEFFDLGDIEPMLNLKSPNLSQVATLVSRGVNQLSGCLKIKIKQHIFLNTYYFQVSNPSLWYREIMKCN